MRGGVATLGISDHECSSLPTKLNYGQYFKKTICMYCTACNNVISPDYKSPYDLSGEYRVIGTRRDNITDCHCHYSSVLSDGETSQEGRTVLF